MIFSALAAFAQNNTYNPFSRFGLGELAPTTLAHNRAMGGAHIALRPDSTMPVFINTGNPAAYSLIKLTTLEVGGTYLYSDVRSVTASQKRWGTSFAYGTLGFPIKKNGAMCIGLMPYSHVGYNTESSVATSGIGNVQYKFSGTGSLNKAFIGYGVMPFYKQLRRYRRYHLYIPDSTKTLSRPAYYTGEFFSKLLSDFSIGFNANYLFGNILNTSRVIYPNSLLYNNTFKESTFYMGDFTGNFGFQTAATIDSVLDRKGRKNRIKQAYKQLSEQGFSQVSINEKRDSIMLANPLQRRLLREKIKFTFGYFMGLNNALKVTHSSVALNYIQNSAGQEILRDTAFYQKEQSGKITLPLEQGFGIGFKKGERLNIVADFAITNWQNFKFINELNALKDNYRIAAGFNFVPDKYAVGHNAMIKRTNYRFGFSYQTGFINLSNTLISDYSISAGFGLPVGIGRLSSMVNISAQAGRMGTNANGLLMENYIRIHFGFTFCDRWFQKFRYD